MNEQRHTAEIDQTCGHPNHGAADHDCAPFTAETAQPIYGMCTACYSIEVELNRQNGVRDFSHIGESAAYPVGYGCEVCS